ncbi:Plasmodium exported protein (PHISTa-like), putative [Plasmodium sp. gorilla clade G3]|nr:Plasmodium exported protein (PHISTa-like), putative [Plasmodium sp. gorilla clade G3]
MKYHSVEYYCEEKNIEYSIKHCSVWRKFINLLSIIAIILVALNCINIRDKNEAMDDNIYHIYKRNLSEFKNVDDSGLGYNCKNIQLKYKVDEENDTLLISESCNSEDYIKYSDIKTNDKCNNIDYNDLSKQLTLEELDNVLDNLDERPSISNLYNIWNHVLGIAKEGFDDMLKDLSYYIEDYLLRYEYQRYHYIRGRRPVCRGTEYSTWYKSMHYIGEALSSTDIENTLKFYNLIKDGASIEEMKNFIYTFIKYYDTLKNDLYNEHKKIFTERMKNPQRLDI